MAKVIEWLTPLLPACLKPFLTADKINEMVEKALEAAKEYWAKNPATLTVPKVG